MRFLNKRVPAGYDTVPLLIFWGLLLAWLLPWAAFLPQSLRSVPIKLRELTGKSEPFAEGELAVLSVGAQ